MKIINKIVTQQEKLEKHTLPSPREHYKTDNRIIPTVDLLPHYFVGENEVFLEALQEYKKLVKYNMYKNTKGKLHIIDAREYLTR